MKQPTKTITLSQLPLCTDTLLPYLTKVEGKVLSTCYDTIQYDMIVCIYRAVKS